MNVNPELTFHSHSKQYQHTKTPKKEGQVNIPYNLLLYFYLKQKDLKSIQNTEFRIREKKKIKKNRNTIYSITNNTQI